MIGVELPQLSPEFLSEKMKLKFVADYYSCQYTGRMIGFDYDNPINQVAHPQRQKLHSNYH